MIIDMTKRAIKKTLNKAQGIGKNESAEHFIERKEGWSPGERTVFDTALMKKDRGRVRKMLPGIPKEYAQRFSKEIKSIIN